MCRPDFRSSTVSRIVEADRESPWRCGWFDRFVAGRFALVYSPVYVGRVLAWGESDQGDYLNNFPLSPCPPIKVESKDLATENEVTIELRSAPLK